MEASHEPKRRSATKLICLRQSHFSFHRLGQESPASAHESSLVQLSLFFVVAISMLNRNQARVLEVRENQSTTRLVGMIPQLVSQTRNERAPNLQIYFETERSATILHRNEILLKKTHFFSETPLKIVSRCSYNQTLRVAKRTFNAKETSLRHFCKEKINGVID